MSVKTNAADAVRFLTWLFGDDPTGYIYIRRSRTPHGATDVANLPVSFSKPGKVNSEWWRINAAAWGQEFCTATIKNPVVDTAPDDDTVNNKQPNCLQITAAWFDVDACKKLSTSGEDFYNDVLLKDEMISCLVRSSQEGLQGYFKLDTPLDIDGKKENFEDFGGLLRDIAYYYGADLTVATLGRLMRLPGSLNLKPEYDLHYLVTADIFPDRSCTVAALREHFTFDPKKIVPQVVLYAITRAISEVRTKGDGNGNHFMLRLAATIRKAGMDKDGCIALFKALSANIGDRDDRINTCVAPTYENKDPDTLASLRSDYGECVGEVEAALEIWVKLKAAYFKKKNLDFSPDLTHKPVPVTHTKIGGVFDERDGHTFYTDQKGAEQLLCNFILKLRGRKRKAETGAVVWMADIITPGSHPKEIDIPADKHNSWQKFSTIIGLPSGITFLQTKMWDQYILELSESCPDRTLAETNYYGILDVDQGKPTLILPGEDHTKYIWTADSDDTAEKGAYAKAINEGEVVKYLTALAKHYPHYHESRYIYPVLGWFCGSFISAFIRAQLKGFPTLMICGLTGSGKSHLIQEGIAQHFGCHSSSSFAGITNFSLRKHLVSNNVMPMIIDEFRDTNELKTQELQATIRSLWDQSDISSGTTTGKVIKHTLHAPLCVIGEHHYSDEASIHRTYTVRIDRNWIQGLNKKSPEEVTQNIDARKWLESYPNRHMMSTLLTQWIRDNMDKIPAIIEVATTLMNETCPVTIQRKRTGFAAIIAGVKLLSCVFETYGVKFFISKKQLIEAIYAADTNISDHVAHDTETLRTLFRLTDQAIIGAYRKHTTHLGTMFVFDPADKDVAYFDLSRWYDAIRRTTATTAATLNNLHAFRDLVTESAKEPGACIMAVNVDHAVFAQNCVKINLKRVAELYKVNVAQWHGFDSIEE